MQRFEKRVKKVMKTCDVVIMLVDSRMPDETRLPLLINLTKKMRRYLITVATKSDLISEEQQKILRNSGIITVSSKKRFGKEELLELLQSRVRNKRIYVAIVGYPDVGKSSLINYLSGSKKARVSPIANTTRGQQFIRLSEEILLVDTPGVFDKDSLTSLAIKGAISPEQIADAVPVIVKIIKRLLKKDEISRLEYYSFKTKESDIELIVEDLLEHVAKKRNLKLKGGEYNIDEAAKIIMRDYQRGVW